MAILDRCFEKNKRAQSLQLSVVRAYFAIEAELVTPFSDGEMDACIQKMSDDNINKLMRCEDEIFRI